ncbi:MAG: hypothetical protein ACOC1F_14335 [Myxococcota bacterium]
MKRLLIGLGCCLVCASIVSCSDEEPAPTEPASPDGMQEQAATHALESTDVKRARDALERDPYFRAHPSWVSALEQLLEMGVRAEQQALAKWGLNFVMDEYLPRKLTAPEGFLP